MSLKLMFQPLRKYADFDGRARRAEYWLFVLFQFVILGIIHAVLMSLMFSSIAAIDTTSDVPPDFSALSGIMLFANLANLASLALLIPNLAVGVRRLHDINRTGWWLVMPGAVFIAGIILFLILNAATIGEMFQSQAAPKETIVSMIGQGFLMIWLPTFIAGLVLFVFTVWEGTKGPNRFGPDPKAPVANVPAPTFSEADPTA